MAEYLDRAVCLSILRAKANMTVSMGAAPEKRYTSDTCFCQSAKPKNKKGEYND